MVFKLDKDFPTSNPVSSFKHANPPRQKVKLKESPSSAPSSLHLCVPRKLQQRRQGPVKKQRTPSLNVNAKNDTVPKTVTLRQDRRNGMQIREKKKPNSKTRAASREPQMEKVRKQRRGGIKTADLRIKGTQKTNRLRKFNQCGYRLIFFFVRSFVRSSWQKNEQ